MKKLLFGLLMLLSISTFGQSVPIDIALEWDASAVGATLPTQNKYKRVLKKGEAILVTTGGTVSGTVFQTGDVFYAKVNKPTAISDFIEIDSPTPIPLPRPQASVWDSTWFNFNANGDNFGIDEATNKAFMGNAAITPLAISGPYDIVPLPHLNKVLFITVGTSVLYDLTTGTTTNCPAMSSTAVGALSANGNVYITQANSNNVYVYNPKTNTLGTAITQPFTSVGVYQTRPLIVPATASRSELIVFFNNKAPDNEEICAIYNVTGNSWTLVTNDGTIASTTGASSGNTAIGEYVSSTDEIWIPRFWMNDVVVLNPAGTITAVITSAQQVPSSAKAILYEKQTNKVFITGQGLAFTAYNPSTKKRINSFTFGSSGEPRDIRLNPNNGYLYVPRINGKMAIIDPRSNTLFKEITCSAGSNLTACAYEPITKTVLACYVSSNKVLIFP